MGQLTQTAVLSTCPFCACGCGLYLHTEEGELVGVSPSEGHPVSRGRLCARGWGAHEAPLWGPRLLSPSVGTEAGRRRVTWNVALEEAATRLRAILSSGGEVGVVASGRCTNEESYLAVRLARQALGTGNVDTPLRVPYQALLSGLRQAGWISDESGTLAHLEASDLVVALEADLAETHPHVAFSVLRALRRGARLLTLAPARTQLGGLASPHLPLDPVRPEAALPGLLEALKEAQAAADLSRVAVVLAPFTGDGRSLRTAVEAVVRLLLSWGGTSGTQVCFLPLPLRANTRGALEMGAAPGLLPGGQPLDDPEARARLEAAWSPNLALDEGRDVEGMLGTVSGLVLLRDHLPACLPAPEPSLEALRSLECLVVLDAFRSPTTDAATVALPLSAFTEEEGTVTSLEGRVQCWRPALSSPGEAREGWRVLVELLGALGVRGGYASRADLSTEMSRVIPGYGPSGLNEFPVPRRLEMGAASFPEGGGGEEDSEPVDGPVADAGAPFSLALLGAYDWEDDVLVESSPTLRRDGASRRKLYPEGRLSMCRQDAQGLGIREGWKVRVSSAWGEAVLPVSLVAGVPPGLLLAPFGFRSQLSEVLGGAMATQVRLERT